jgi:hypothetical protein
MLIGLDNANQIIAKCALHKVAYATGLALVITLFLVVFYFLTKKQDEPDKFQVPGWLPFIPSILLILYATRQKISMLQEFQTERLEFELSGMPKKEYFSYKVGDDRSNRSLFASAASAGILSGTNLLGPFLRGDKP